MELYIWTGIAICISQSAMFSGLNLAFFSVSRLRLEVEAETGRKSARKVLDMRKDAHFLLTTVLWGNVSANVLLALLSDSVLTGVGAFVFSTFVITIIGEILPQGYFSRHAIKTASLLLPVFRFYQFLLYPIAKPSAILLDWWLGEEGIQYFRERDLRELIRKHIEASEADIDRIEGLGALNFLAIDDLLVALEGEPVDPKSVMQLDMSRGFPVFPEFERKASDPFLQKVQSSEKKWVIITDQEDEPQLVLDADGFLRTALFESRPLQPYAFCHRPIVVKDSHIRIGSVIWQLKVRPETAEDDVIDHDVILVWSDEKRLITGADILGRLLRGIVTRTRT